MWVMHGNPKKADAKHADAKTHTRREQEGESPVEVPTTMNVDNQSSVDGSASMQFNSTAIACCLAV